MKSLAVAFVSVDEHRENELPRSAAASSAACCFPWVCAPAPAWAGRRVPAGPTCRRPPAGTQTPSPQVPPRSSLGFCRAWWSQDGQGFVTPGGQSRKWPCPRGRAQTDTESLLPLVLGDESQVGGGDLRSWEWQQDPWPVTGSRPSCSWSPPPCWPPGLFSQARRRACWVGTPGLRGTSPQGASVTPWGPSEL